MSQPSPRPPAPPPAAPGAPGPPPARPPRAGWRPPLKTSAGIVVCRRNAASGRLEALLVRKRYTYAFSEFLHGRYGRAAEAGGRGVLPLLERMTAEELLDVWSLNFEHMWSRVWLVGDSPEVYAKRHLKFTTTFVRADGGKALRRLVLQARPSGACLWEAPKGRHLTAREADVHCAVREVREEACLEKGDYRLLPGARIRFRYLSGGVRYARCYYVALANPHLAAQVSPGHGRAALRPIPLMAEVGEIRWLDIEGVRVRDGPERYLEAVVRPAFALVKKFLRGRWACRPGVHLLGEGLEAPFAPAPPPAREAGGDWAVARRGRRGGASASQDWRA